MHKTVFLLNSFFLYLIKYIVVYNRNKTAPDDQLACWLIYNLMKPPQLYILFTKKNREQYISTLYVQILSRELRYGVYLPSLNYEPKQKDDFFLLKPRYFWQGIGCQCGVEPPKIGLIILTKQDAPLSSLLFILSPLNH